ncbi:MAG: hypothetical protein H6Q69_2856 [Firmicutes bacterium]|nr:hypothetical protein [Bacillota bacterium]
MKLIKFLLSKGVIYAIILAVFYQIVMVGLYIYGYHVLPNGVNLLAINVVNQDGDKGTAIEEELVPNLSKSFSKVIKSAADFYANYSFPVYFNILGFVWAKRYLY